MGEEDWRSDDDDDKGSLGKDVVNTLHFGGGMIEKKGPNIYGPGGDGHDGGENKAPKNRLDALQEIVAKSKMFKLQKKEAKEEQENDREKLDKDFQSLVSQSMLDFKPTRRDRSEDKDENDIIDEYDLSLRAMAFEVKAKPSDRTKSDEEKAVEARTKLEELEAARLRRMNNIMDPEDSSAVDKALNHNSHIEKKRKRVTDDEVDGSFGSSYAKGEEDEDDEDEEDEEEVEEEEEGEEGEEDDEEEDDEEEDDDDEDDWEDEDAEEGDVKVEVAVKKRKSKTVNKDEDEDDEGEEEDGEDGEGEDEEEEAEEEEGGDEEVVKEEEVTVSDRVVKKLKKADKAVELLASEGNSIVAVLLLYCCCTVVLKSSVTVTNTSFI